MHPYPVIPHCSQSLRLWTKEVGHDQWFSTHFFKVKEYFLSQILLGTLKSGWDGSWASVAGPRLSSTACCPAHPVSLSPTPGCPGPSRALPTTVWEYQPGWKPSASAQGALPHSTFPDHPTENIPQTSCFVFLHYVMLYHIISHHINYMLYLFLYVIQLHICIVPIYCTCHHIISKMAGTERQLVTKWCLRAGPGVPTFWIQHLAALFTSSVTLSKLLDLVCVSFSSSVKWA